MPFWTYTLFIKPLFPCRKENARLLHNLHVCLFLNEHTRNTNIPENSSGIEFDTKKKHKLLSHDLSFSFVNFSIVALSNISFLFSLFIVYFDIARIIFLGSRKFWNTNSECEREWEINV